MRIVFTAVLLAASAALTAWSVRALPYYDAKTGHVEPLVWVTAALWALFALSLAALVGGRRREATGSAATGSATTGSAATAREGAERGVTGRASVVLVLVGSLAIGVVT